MASPEIFDGGREHTTPKDRYLDEMMTRVVAHAESAVDRTGVSDLREAFRRRVLSVLGEGHFEEELKGVMRRWSQTQPELERMGCTREDLLAVAARFVSASRSQSTLAQRLPDVFHELALFVGECIPGSGIKIPPYMDVLFAEDLRTHRMPGRQVMRFRDWMEDFFLDSAGLEQGEKIFEAARECAIFLAGKPLESGQVAALRTLVLEAKQGRTPLIPRIRELVAPWRTPPEPAPQRAARMTAALKFVAMRKRGAFDSDRDGRDGNGHPLH